MGGAVLLDGLRRRRDGRARGDERRQETGGARRLPRVGEAEGEEVDRHLPLRGARGARLGPERDEEARVPLDAGELAAAPGDGGGRLEDADDLVRLAAGGEPRADRVAVPGEAGGEARAEEGGARAGAGVVRAEEAAAGPPEPEELERLGPDAVDRRRQLEGSSAHGRRDDADAGGFAQAGEAGAGGEKAGRRERRRRAALGADEDVRGAGGFDRAQELAAPSLHDGDERDEDGRSGGDAEEPGPRSLRVEPQRLDGGLGGASPGVLARGRGRGQGRRGG